MLPENEVKNSEKTEKTEDGRRTPAENVRFFTGILKQLSLLTQFGLSLLVPTVLCLGACFWLTRKTGVGAWIFIPGLILGLGSSGMVAWKFYRQVMKDEKKDADGKEKTISFNRHE